MASDTGGSGGTGGTRAGARAWSAAEHTAPPSGGAPISGRADTVPVVGVIAVVVVTAWTAVFVAVFGRALADVAPWLSVLVNVVGVGGVAPPMWRRRRLRTARWLIAGLLPGALLGWVALAVIWP